MHAISPALAAHLEGASLSLTDCWLVVRRDGTTLRVTAHDQDLEISGETYESRLSYAPTAITTRADLSVDQTEFQAILDSDRITEQEIRAGLWDGARVEIFTVNWADLSMGRLFRLTGTLGQLTIREDGAVTAEIRGLAARLGATIGHLWQAECHLDLGEAKCGIDLTLGAGWTYAATLESLSGAATFVVAATGPEAKPDSYFEGGTAIFDSGTNAGVAREIYAWDQATRTVTLLEPPPYTPAPGDTLRLQPGCDGRWATCKGTFANQLNHRGAPTLPGANSIIETPVRA